jgi:hypothetical protein
MTKLWSCIALLIVALPLSAQNIAITNVHVIPMDHQRVLNDYVVLVRDGEIVAVGSRDSIQIPRNARRIDGGGGFLLPGLADFHVHIQLRSDLDAYLAHGVTTVANMGSPDSRTLRMRRDSIRDGKLLGPEMFVGYFVDGPQQRGGISTVDSARIVVERADEFGYDFIKVYNSLSAEQFDVIMQEARERDITVVGHGVRSVGLEKAFAAGQAMVVHAEEFMYTDLRRRTDGLEVPRVVAFTKQRGAYVIPNLVAFDAIARQWGKREVLDEFLQRPEARFLPEYWKQEWRERDYVTRAGSIDAANRFLRRFTLDLHQGGVPIIAGSDSPVIPGLFPGLSLHDDLRFLVAAGLSPFDAIAAATRNPGQFAQQHFHTKDRFGIIAPGYRADFVLVRENPLIDVGRLRELQGVMVRGRWLNRERLDSLRVAGSDSQ